MEPDDAHLDGCDLGDLTEEEITPDDLADMVVLFAEALDPNTDVTVEEVEAEWREVFNESPGAS